MSATASLPSPVGGGPSPATAARRPLGGRLRSLLLVLPALGCGGPAPSAGDPGDSGSASAVTSPSDSAHPIGASPPPAGRAPTPPPRAATAPPLSPLADSIAQRLVFAPVDQIWFTAAARAKRLLVDLGRIDLDLGKDVSRLAAYREAAAASSPFPEGTRLLLRGPWGSDEATIAGFDVWNGRIVATLDAPPRVDSIARVTDPLTVAALRLPGGGPLPGDGTGAHAAPSASVTDSAGRPSTERGEGEGGSTSVAASGATPACREKADAAFAARLTALARATEDSLRGAEDQPIYARLRNSLKARRSIAVGCFGAARGVVIVTLYAGDYEWVRERVLLVGETRTVVAAVRDLRFRAHEALHALDADGDGVDDLAARAWTPRGGGTVILRLADGPRFERLASGFAWER